VLHYLHLEDACRRHSIVEAVVLLGAIIAAAAAAAAAEGSTSQVHPVRYLKSDLV